LYYP